MTAQYLRPDTLEEALDVLDQHGDDAKVIAGGTAVVLLLQQKLIAPRLLVDLSNLPALSEIHSGEDGLRIGPLQRLSEIEHSARIRSAYPALAQSAGAVGNVRIRNQATLGGNLAEADYASDPPTCLLGMDAILELSSSQGSRRVGVSDFLLGMYTTALRPNEILTGITLPPLPPGTRMTYLKFKTRSSEDRPCLGVAAFTAMEEQRVIDLRVAVGAACEIPRRLPDVEALALNQPLKENLISEIAESYAEGIETLDDLRGSSWYRKEMIRVHVRRVLEELRDGNR